MPDPCEIKRVSGSEDDLGFSNDFYKLYVCGVFIGESLRKRNIEKKRDEINLAIRNYLKKEAQK